MDIELRQLRALVAVVDEGSFTDAAIALGVSQASASRAVASLEAALGARVLHRTTREVAPTVVGAQVVAEARAVLDRVDRMRLAVAEAGVHLRVGYAWAALGRHTTAVQRKWAERYPETELVFAQSNSRTAGLAEGVADVAVLRRAVEDRRLHTVLVGVEPRYAALARTDPLARRRTVRMADFAGRTVAIDAVTGTTHRDLWPGDGGPAALRPIHGVDEWLTLLASGRALGLTSEATARQHPRPGVVYRRVADAPPVAVLLAWWAADPPPAAHAFAALVAEAYGSAPR